MKQPTQEYGFRLIQPGHQEKFTPKQPNDQLWHEGIEEWIKSNAGIPFGSSQTYRRPIDPGPEHEIIPEAEARRFNGVNHMPGIEWMSFDVACWNASPFPHFNNDVAAFRRRKAISPQPSQPVPAEQPKSEPAAGPETGSVVIECPIESIPEEALRRHFKAQYEALKVSQNEVESLRGILQTEQGKRKAFEHDYKHLIMFLLGKTPATYRLHVKEDAEQIAAHLAEKAEAEKAALQQELETERETRMADAKESTDLLDMLAGREPISYNEGTRQQADRILAALKAKFSQEPAGAEPVKLSDQTPEPHRPFWAFFPERPFLAKHTHRETGWVLYPRGLKDPQTDYEINGSWAATHWVYCNKPTQIPVIEMTPAEQAFQDWLDKNGYGHDSDDAGKRQRARDFETWKAAWEARGEGK